MENKLKSRTEQILVVMRILSIVAFIGLAIVAGAILISFGVSLFNPEAAGNLYDGLNLYKVLEYDFWHYTVYVSFIAAVAIMKAYAAYLVVKTLSTVTMTNPFTIEVATMLEKISYVLLGTWVVGMLGNVHSAWLEKTMGGLDVNWVSGELVFVAGLVYIISQVFKRGVELQSENELTV